jgi:hypothetical protein
MIWVVLACFRPQWPNLKTAVAYFCGRALRSGDGSRHCLGVRSFLLEILQAFMTATEAVRTRAQDLMKFVADRPSAHPEIAARKLMEIANAVDPVQDDSVYIPLINWPVPA